MENKCKGDNRMCKWEGYFWGCYMMGQTLSGHVHITRGLFQADMEGGRLYQS